MAASVKSLCTCRALPALLLAGWIGVLSGCALFAGRETGGWNVGSSNNGDITLEVRNDNSNDARIYIRWNGDRRRLGFVSSRSSEVFTTPWRSGDLRIEVDFLAGRSFVTPPTSVSPGERLDFRIPVTR